MECIICLSDYTLIKYREKDGEWLESPYCETCINHFIETQWDNYVKTVKSETCKKSLKRMIDAGVPLYVKESVGMPVNNSEGIYEFMFGNKVISGKLKGVYEGDELIEFEKFLSDYLQSLD